MNVFYIIKQKGYQFEDLSEENQRIISWLNILREDAENFEYEIDEYEDSILGKIKAEIAQDVMEQFMTWMDAQIAEYQISMIESQPDEAEGSV